MSVKFWSFVIFVWLIGVMLGSTFELQSAESTWAGSGTGGYNTAPVTKLEYLMDVSNAVQVTEVAGIIPMPTFNKEYIETLGDIVLWRFSFLYDDTGQMAYGMVYYIFFMPFVVMGMLGIALITYSALTGNLTLT